MASKRLDWSRELPRQIAIPDVMTLKTLADVRKLIGHLPAEHQQKSTWRHVEAQLDQAARGGEVRDVSVALMIVLQLGGVPYRAEKSRVSKSSGP